VLTATPGAAADVVEPVEPVEPVEADDDDVAVSDADSSAVELDDPRDGVPVPVGPVADDKP